MHILYWILVVLLYSFIWGTYDGEYLRNLFVQLWSLPARLILAYLTISTLFPLFLKSGRYWTFTFSWFILLFLVAVIIQRPIIFYLVEGTYLPYKSDTFYNLIAFVNTGIDISIGTVPLLFFQAVFAKQDRKSRGEKEHLLLKEGSNHYKVQFDDILFIESQRNLLLTVTNDLQVKSYGNMASVEARLPEVQFKRVHRSYIVNLDKIDAFTSTGVKVRTHTIPVGRHYKKDVTKVLEERFL